MTFRSTLFLNAIHEVPGTESTANDNDDDVRDDDDEATSGGSSSASSSPPKFEAQ
jgi:hypothetical protein